MSMRSKRFSYVSESSSSSDSYRTLESSIKQYESSDHSMKGPNDRNNITTNKETIENSGMNTRKKERKSDKPKCSSKNALIARANRMKKKQYLQNLESENRSLKETNRALGNSVKRLSFQLNSLRKEVRYLRSTLVNSTDISNLVKCIRQNTGMSVTSLYDNSLSCNNCISKPPTLPVFKETTEPFIEPSLIPSEMAWSSSMPDILDIDAMVNEMSDPMFSFDNLDQENCSSSLSSNSSPHCTSAADIPQEHNYTIISKEIDLHDHDEDAGVCLHVSKNRLSLEFCHLCSEKAKEGWSK